MLCKSFTLLALPLLSPTVPIAVPVEECRGLHKGLSLYKRGLFGEALKRSDSGHGGCSRSRRRACKADVPLRILDLAPPLDAPLRISDDNLVTIQLE